MWNLASCYFGIGKEFVNAREKTDGIAVLLSAARRLPFGL